jgi:predicted RNA-binding Zn ribbon-like protein
VPSTSKRKRPNRSDFVFVGEHPAIDFVNTLAVPHGYLEDLLRSWSDLIDWLSQTGLSTDPSLNLPAARGEEALKSVVELRRAWQDVLTELVAGGKVSDAFLGRLNRFLAEDTFHEKLHRQGRKGVHLVRSNSQLKGGKLVLAILGRQIAIFLAEANLHYLRRCANTTSCVLYFYDTTKNHRRQWCSATVCGNRHKVAQFRKRQIKAQS